MYTPVCFSPGGSRVGALTFRITPWTGGVSTGSLTKREKLKVKVQWIGMAKMRGGHIWTWNRF